MTLYFKIFLPIQIKDSEIKTQTSTLYKTFIFSIFRKFFNKVVFPLSSNFNLYKIRSAFTGEREKKRKQAEI